MSVYYSIKSNNESEVLFLDNQPFLLENQLNSGCSNPHATTLWVGVCICVSASQPLLPFLPYYGTQVDKAGHLRLENPDNLQNILQLRKNKKARKAPVRKTPPSPEAVVRYSMRRWFNLNQTNLVK